MKLINLAIIVMFMSIFFLFTMIVSSHNNFLISKMVKVQAKTNANIMMLIDKDCAIIDALKGEG